MTIKYLFDTVREMFALYFKLRFFRSPGASLLSTGLSIIALTIGANFVVSANVSFSWIKFSGTAQSPQVPDCINFTGYGVGLLCVIIGTILLYRTTINAIKLTERKSVLAVQLIGLSDVVQSSIADAIPAEVVGQRKPVMIDVREQLKGGFRIQEAVEEVSRVSARLRSEVTGMAVEDYTVYAGGLAPVPLLFQFGNLLEDESLIHWMDWHRDEKKWIRTEQGTPLAAWPVPDVSHLSAGEVVLAVPVSYPITDDVLSRGFPGRQVLRWGPQERLLGRVVDEQSSQAICEVFRNLLVRLAEQGINRIHLVLAAPAALSIRLGNSYDPRNMPPLIVYQYEQANQNPYPWGVEIRVHQGMRKGILIENTCSIGNGFIT